jgi:hypothetical protein
VQDDTAPDGPSDARGCAAHQAFGFFPSILIIAAKCTKIPVYLRNRTMQAEVDPSYWYLYNSKDRALNFTDRSSGGSAVEVVDPTTEEEQTDWTTSFTEGTQGPVPTSEDFMIAVHHISAISAIPLPNLFLTLYNCIRASNLLVSSQAPVPLTCYQDWWIEEQPR